MYVEIGSRSHRRASISMLLGSIITFAIMYSPQPLISLFSKEYGISPATASASISLSTISLAIGMLFVSILSNKWGRKKVMSVSLVLTSVLAILSSFTNNFSLFLVIRFLEGITIAGFPSIAMAYLNEEFSPKAIGTVIGSYVAGTAIGGFTGRIVIGALTDLFNWHSAFMIQGLLGLLGSLWFWAYLPESNNFVRKSNSLSQWLSSIRATLFSKALAPMYITGFILMGVYITIMNYIGYPLTKAPYYLSQTVFGFLFVVNLGGSWSSLVFGRLADRYSRPVVLASAIAIFIVGALLTLHSVLIVKIIGVAAVAFGFFAGHSVTSGWVGILAPKEHKGQAASFYLIFYYTGSSLCGWSSGFVLNQFGWNSLIYYVCALAAIAILISCRPAGLGRWLQTRYTSYGQPLHK